MYIFNSTTGGIMKKLLLAVLCLLSSVSLFAQNLELNWREHSVDSQPRNVTEDNTDKSLAIVGGGSHTGSSTNNTLTIDTVNVSITTQNAIDDAYNSTNNPTLYRNGAYVAGGAVLNNQATNNTLNLLKTTLTGRDAYGGTAVLKDTAARFGNGSANNNTVNIEKVTTASSNLVPTGALYPIGGNVYGGYSEYAKGEANDNIVNITDSTIHGNIYGGVVFDQLTLEDLAELEGVLDSKANNNTVYVKDSFVEGTIAGAAGASNTNNNTVVVDNIKTTDTTNDDLKLIILGVNDNHGVQDGDVSVVYANNNSVTIKNSTVTSAAAIDSDSINAEGNSLTLEKSVVTNGSIYSVNMAMARTPDGNPVLATVKNNRLLLNNMPTSSLTEIGGSLNLVGTANGNQINIQDSDITLVNSDKKFMDKLLDSKNLETFQLLELPDDKGLMFAGASMYYSQTGSGEQVPEAPEAQELAVAGTNSDGNNILLKNGSFEGNIIGGMSAHIVEVNYIEETENSEDPTKPEKKWTYKKGLQTYVKNWDYDKNDWGLEEKDGEPAEKIDDVYSASNNTIVLDSVDFEGTLFGGYVYGAELKEKNMIVKDNTVVLRGNVKLNDSVLYGSNVINDYTQTNKLVFDRVNSSFNNINQFKNFNPTWTIIADYNTNADFQFDHVTAVLTPDPSSTMKVAEGTVVKTQSEVDLTGIEQGEDLTKYDLISSTISLGQERVGIYTYDLTPTKGVGNTVEWTLSSKKDQANMEVYGQLPLVGLALASEGGELLTHSVADAWKSDNEVSTFLNGGYHHTRYETGSGFDLDSGLVQVGAWKKFNEELLAGFFAKYSNGSYETYPIKVTGSANVFGGGLMTSYRYSETGRLEASLEAGYMDMDFESASLISSFNSKGMYYGASAGFVESLMQDLDLFANINWLRKGDDDITDNLGQKVLFDTMQSLNLRFGADYTLSNINWGGLIPSLGAMGIYEFDGESSVEIDGNKNSDASLKGMSGRGQISLAYQNNDSFLPLRTVFTAYGQLGNRRGFGGEVNISFEF